MDFRMIYGLFNQTAALAAQGKSAVYAFQFGNELYSNVEATRYAADILSMAQMVKQIWATTAPHASVPVFVGPDNGADDMSAEHLDAILNGTAPNGALAAASYHDYWDECSGGEERPPPAGLALNVSCIDARIQAVVDKYGPSCSAHRTPLWLTEGALHSNSGANGLTNSFRSTTASRM